MEKVKILCATDDKYVPYCGIMLTSVFLNHPHGSVEVYILLEKPLSLQNSRKFEGLANKYSNEIKYVFVDNSLLKTIQINGMSYWTIATYYRLLAAQLLPDSVHRILYLDCDIIVDGNVSALWKMNWDGIAAGVVPDIFNDDDRNYKLLSYNKELGYFNAGVVFMNLDYWRDYNVGDKCFEYLKSNYRILQSNDQDVLNYVLKNCKKCLPLTYNFQIQFFSKYFRSEVFSESFRKEVDEVGKPLIVHYAAPVKPWMVDYYGMPFGRLWHKYKRRSLWRFMSDIWPDCNHFRLLVKRYLLWPLNIKRPATIYIDDITI